MELNNIPEEDKEFFLNNLEHFRDIITNMIERRDPNVYICSYEQSEEIIEKYNLYINQILGKIVDAQKKYMMNIVPSTYVKCGYCGGYHPPTDFLTSYHTGEKTNTVFCKKCCDDLFIKCYDISKNISESIIMFSSMINILVHRKAIDNFIKEKVKCYNIENTKNVSLANDYLDILWNICDEEDIPNAQRIFMYSNFGSIPFKLVDKLAIKSVYDIEGDICISGAKNKKSNDSKGYFSGASEDYSDISELYDIEEIKKIPYFKKIRKSKIPIIISEWETKWGSYTPTELWYLEERYSEWNDSYVISDLSREKLVKQLCYEELAIFEARQNGEKVSDRIKNFRELMRDSDLTPKKKKLSKEEEKQKGLIIKNVGDLIKYAEKDKPIIVRDDDLWDVDKMDLLWKSIAGTIGRTLGVENPYIRVFEDTYKDYTIDIQKLANELDSGDNTNE